MESQATDFTRLLQEVNRRDESAFSRLLPMIYDELRRIARRYFHREQVGHTLQPTALVHEAYLKLVNHHNVEFQSRRHFVAVAARAMRQVLVNHAEHRRAAKRGGGWGRVELDDTLSLYEDRSVDLLELDEALDRLAGLDEKQAKLVELRFFGGLTVEETARVLGLSRRTAEREWTMARAWLRCELTR
ncbi:MAG: sigma-70 family RNA polymerase sigma factor [Planctomycetota bacterium]